MKNSVNCWNPLRALRATAQPETANATAKNRGDWAISSQAPFSGEGSTTIPQGSRAETLEMPSAQNGQRYSLAARESTRRETVFPTRIDVLYGTAQYYDEFGVRLTG